MTSFERRLTLVFVLACVLSAAPSRAQSWLDRTVVRQDLNTKNDVPQPAFLQITVPEGKSTLVAAGVGMVGNVIDSTLLTLGPSFEYLRNTEISRPVDSLKAGMAFEWQTRVAAPASNGIDNSPVFDGKVAFVRDGIRESSGVQALLTYTHVFVGRHRHWLPNNEHLFHPELSVVYSPSVGIEMERDGQGPAADAGQAVRAVAVVTVVAYPLRARVEQRLECTASVSSRSDMVKTLASYEGRQHTLVSVGVNFYLLKQARRSAGVGVTFVDGDDPSKGFEQQRVLLAGFRLQLK
jgi:hypothetical protein